MRKWKVLRSARILDEKYMKVRKDVVELSDGKTQYEYFLWEVPDVVAVVPVTDEGRVVMIREYKHGAQEVMLKYSAGYVDGSETVADSAKRELKEETGYAAARWTKLAVVISDAAKSTGRVHLFLAEGGASGSRAAAGSDRTGGGAVADARRGAE